MTKYALRRRLGRSNWQNSKVKNKTSKWQLTNRDDRKQTVQENNNGATDIKGTSIHHTEETKKRRFNSFNRRLDNQIDLLSYARRSVPSSLEIKLSSIPNAGEGIFAKTALLANVEYGPFEGRIVSGQDRRESIDGSYAWEIVSEEGIVKYCIDGKDENNSNWMRFINCARAAVEQNLIAFQRNDAIYYRTYKDISIGAELLVWYGDHFACRLGITFDDDPSCKIGIHCRYCGRYFGPEISLESHEKQCQGKQICNQSTKPKQNNVAMSLKSRKCKKILKSYISRQGEIPLKDKQWNMLICNESSCGSAREQGKEAENVPTKRVRNVLNPFICEGCGKCYRSKRLVKRHAQNGGCSPWLFQSYGEGHCWKQGIQTRKVHKRRTRPRLTFSRKSKLPVNNRCTSRFIESVI